MYSSTVTSAFIQDILLLRIIVRLSDVTHKFHQFQANFYASEQSGTVDQHVPQMSRNSKTFI